MRRRNFIAFLGGAAAFLPLAARAQQADRMRRVSLLFGIAEDHPETKSRVKAFQKGLRDLGWVEGRNIHIDYRFAASDVTASGGMRRNWGELKPDVILGNTSPVVAALRRATSIIPIVFAVVNDPVGQGFISSLAHPGGNVTGFTFIEFEMVGKWLAMLNDVVPNLSQAKLMFNPAVAPYYDIYLRSFETMPRSIKAESPRRPFMTRLKSKSLSPNSHAIQAAA